MRPLNDETKFKVDHSNNKNWKKKFKNLKS